MPREIQYKDVCHIQCHSQINEIFYEDNYCIYNMSGLCQVQLTLVIAGVEGTLHLVCTTSPRQGICMSTIDLLFVATKQGKMKQ
jgi:hypothetical protein